MNFDANISFLFTEHPFLDRFAAARQAGLGAVEFFWPAEEDLDAIPARVREAGVEVALFNFYAGDMAAGERGLLSDPERQGEFREAVPRALALAEQIGCTRCNALVGKRIEQIGAQEQLELAVQNVRWVADQASTGGVTITIEAINTFENGPYLLARTDETLEFIDRVDRPNVKLQYDAYHMQRMEGNVVATLREQIDRIAHIQIADSPDRGEPGSGEIAYDYVLDQIESLGYDGYVGLEYRPRGETTESLAWLRAYRNRTEGAAS